MKNKMRNLGQQKRTPSASISLSIGASLAAAALAVTGCQSTGTDSSNTGSGSSTTSINRGDAVCDPFNPVSSGGPHNGLKCTISYRSDDDRECSGVSDFESRAKSASQPIYLNQLYIPTRSFTDGFTTMGHERVEDDHGNPITRSFALHIEGSIRLGAHDQDGSYQFAIASDDGAILQIDDGSGFHSFIDNDGHHATKLGCSHQSVSLTHSSSLPIKLDYFQGSHDNLALTLLWRKVDTNSNWHENDDQHRDPDNANPLNDSDCDRTSDDLYFDWHESPSVPNDNWEHLLARGWSVVPSDDFFLPDSAENPCNTATQCYTDTFTQPQQVVNNSVDLLLLTDTNSSDYNRADISNHLHTFANQLPSGVDLSVGVMLGYGRSAGGAGQLNHSAAVNTVLNSTKLSMADMESQLNQNLSQLEDDSASAGGELGLYSLSQALSSQLQSAKNSGFFRPKAALSVIFLSDDGDQCAADGSLYSECQNITPASVLAQLQGLMGSRPFDVNAIVHTAHVTDPADSWATEDEYGAGYIDLANMANGLAINMNIDSNLNVTNYDQAMQQIGQKLASQLQLVSNVKLLNAFTLSHTGIDTSTLAVSVDGTTAQYTYNANQGEIDLANAGTYGSSIHVNYCMMGPTPSPSPSASVTATPSPSPSVTATPSPTVTASPSPSPTVSSSPSPSPSASVTATPSPSPSVTASPSPTVTASPTPSPTVSSSPSPSPSVSVTATPSPSPSVTASPSPTVTASPSPSPTPSPTVSSSPSPSPSPSPSSSTCTGPFCGGGPLGA